MESIRLDKTVCKAQSFEEAEKNKLFGKEVPVADRLKLSFHLSCTIHGIKEGHL